MSLSADGSFLLFESLATGGRHLVSRAAGFPGRGGNGFAAEPVISGDGRFIAYLSNSTDLIPGQSAGDPFSTYVFLYDRLTGSTTLVSRKAGSPLVPADEPAYDSGA